MRWKTIIQIVGAIFVLPGFIFDLCVGFAFIANDGRTDHHEGDFISQWAFDLVNTFPDFVQLPFFISVYVGILPAAIVCITVTLGVIFFAAYALNGVIGSILQLPFTGKVRWILLTELTD